MTDPQTNDIEVTDEIKEDTSRTVIYELSVQLQNGRLNEKQRAALHKMLVGFARRARLSVMMALPDTQMGKVALYRISSTTGRDKVEYFEGE
jgi:acyl-coenzyme A synthetase/AMP-(fatty) acid ligase